MGKIRRNEAGFSPVEVVLVLVIVALIGVAGWFVYNHNKKPATNSVATTTTSKPATTETNRTTQAPDPTANWAAYSDNSGSGLSVKYPTDWQVQTESKVWAWYFQKKADANTTIGFRWIADNNSKTPKQEWDNCPSLDACGHQASDKLLESNTATINGAEAYQAKMQGDNGVYHATILKSNKTSSNGQVYVEAIIYQFK
jgi:uncharacterized protein YxeA